jgi:ankyrin repeat protein
MFLAIRDENIPKLRELLVEGVDLNIKDEVIFHCPIMLTCSNHLSQHGFTPLHVACISGNTHIVEFLLSQGSQVNALDTVECCHDFA